MPIIPVDSVDDPRILAYRNLPAARLPRDPGLFIAEGAWLVERLLASQLDVDSLFVEPAHANRFVGQVGENVPVYTASRDLLKNILGFNFHRCVLACGRRPANGSLDDVLQDLPRAATIVVLSGVHDPENLGGVLRNCAAFAADAVLVGPGCAEPFSRRVLRVSMGTPFKLPIIQSVELHAQLASLRKQHGFESVATVLDATATPLETVGCVKRTALLLGNEAHGLDRHLVDQCDHRVTIPMQLETDSLNVAVASGIFLYHFTRRWRRRESRIAGALA